MIFDLHCDTIWKIKEGRNAIDPPTLKSSGLQIDEEKLIEGGYVAQCFAVWVHAGHPDPYGLCNELIGLYYEELNGCGRIRPAFSYRDITENVREVKISALLTLEDGAPIGDDIGRIEEFYTKGVRMVCLTWNYENSFGYTNFGADGKFFSNTSQGLTAFGRQAVEEMNRLGIIVDVSHLSDAGFYDVIECSSKPIAVSHSNARALCNHPRNLTDRMLKRLAANGGVIGMNYAAPFLHSNRTKGRDTVFCLTEHIKHIKRLIGCDYIALGSDFDGIDPDIALKNASLVPGLIDALEGSGFTADEIEKITYKNALRLFKDN